jgi:hypothetical protein
MIRLSNRGSRAFRWTCSIRVTVLQTRYSSLLLVSEPEFHEEWLRDGPCDATTTCLGNPGVWCQLSPAFREETGNMRFGVHRVCASRYFQSCKEVEVVTDARRFRCSQQRGHNVIFIRVAV